MYTPLYIKTDYSLLSSLIKIDDLIKYLKKYNITSCAICDDNLYGTMEFVTKLKKENIKPVIGLDLNNILLYAKTKQGYYNLVKIETLKNKELLNMDYLKKYNSDLICICLNEESFSEYKKIYHDIYLGISSLKEEKEYHDYNTVYVNKTLYLEKVLYKYLPYVFLIRDG